MERSAQLAFATGARRDPQKSLLLAIQLCTNGRAEMIGDLTTAEV
jgi:hypothetical protein